MRFINLGLLFCLLCLAGCSRPENKIDHNQTTIQIYLVEALKGQELKVKPLERKVAFENSKLKDIILALLKGATKEEIKAGYGSEIPKETRLIWIEENKDKIKINFSEEFASGGGSESMILRYKQLAKSIAQKVPTKPVYILVEGKELKTIGGEGLVVEQPIYEAQSETSKEQNL